MNFANTTTRRLPPPPLFPGIDYDPQADVHRASVPVLILGGGPAGRCAQMHFGTENSLVVDKSAMQPLPQPLGAVYLWTPLPTHWTDCHPFKVFTTIDGERPTQAGMEAYKRKVGKTNDIRPLSEMPEFAYEQTGYDVLRWPSTRGLYNCRVRSISLERRVVRLDNSRGQEIEIRWTRYCINTIALPTVADMFVEQQAVNLPPSRDPEWKYAPLWVFQKQVAPHGSVMTMFVDYNTGPEPYYRSTVRNGLMQLESLSEWPKGSKISRVFPGKIWPLRGSEEVLQKIRITGFECIGRFGAWRPNELLHHTVERLLEMKP